MSPAAAADIPRSAVPAVKDLDRLRIDELMPDPQQPILPERAGMRAGGVPGPPAAGDIGPPGNTALSLCVKRFPYTSCLFSIASEPLQDIVT